MSNNCDEETPLAVQLESDWRKEAENIKSAEDESKKIQEEISSLNEFVSECEERLSFKKKLKEDNLKANDNRPDESFFFKLDSNLKKTTALIKRLKNFTESQRDSLIKDLKSFNLTKYVGEIATAIVETKLKMSDINSALTISSLMYQLYSDFAPAYLESWQKVLLTKKEDKIVNLAKYRVDLRFFADLITVGVLPEKDSLNLLSSQLHILTTTDKDDYPNLPIVISFCRHCGDDYAALVSQKYRLLSEQHKIIIPASQFLKVDRQKSCNNLLKEYYSNVSKHLVEMCKILRLNEKENKKIIQIKGELSDERKEKFELLQLNFYKFLQNVTIFADLLDEDLPELPKEEAFNEEFSNTINLFFPARNTETEGNSIFEDEDTRQFYETIKDLKALIPGILYKDSEKAEPIIEESSQDDTDAIDDLEAVDETNEVAEDVAVGDNKHDEEEEQNILMELEEDESESGATHKIMLETFLDHLPNCINRELIDQAAIDFCMKLNTTTNRRKLVRALFMVQRTRYDLLPFYARLVATLHPCMPNISTDLESLLKTDLRFHVKKKDQIKIESKLKTVRFIGELVKFKMFKKFDALHCLKILLSDFRHHNIEMACALLESCGRFLYKSEDSHHRTKVFLDVIMRKKLVSHLDPRYIMMIENAFYYCNPPELPAAEEQKILPPMHEYIRRLLYKELTRTTVERVLKQMRKLNWNDEEIFLYAFNCLTEIWNLRYSYIQYCANLLAGLVPYQEELCIHVVDAVLENIRIGMELNQPRYNQQRLSTVKYLGELYNYRLVESTVIFSTLYSFITFGSSFDESVVSELDPPEHLLRIRLICVLLETCGMYFDRGSSKKKLDCFLTYFQKYYWFKKKSNVWDDILFPLEIDALVGEMFENLRPKLKRFQCWLEALEACNLLDQEYRNKIYEILKTNANSNNLLGIIHETEYEEFTENDQPFVYEDDDEGDDERDNRHRQVDEADDENDVPSDHTQSDEALETTHGAPKLLKCKEDDDFLITFDKMMSETLLARTQESMKLPTVEIAVPIKLKTRLDDLGSDEEVKHGSIPFTIMLKKGNKTQLTTMEIPVSEKIAAKIKQQKIVELEEKERMKKVVLNMHERQEEEDYQEMLNQLNRAVVFQPKEKKYQHQKGVPNIDGIFGSKKR